MPPDVTGASLGPAARAAAIEPMASATLDVLVIGGGVAGAGAALDAATRGLRSPWSRRATWPAAPRAARSKLIHGGLRYLEQLDFPLVARGAARARPAAQPARAAPGAAGAVPLPAAAAAAGSAPYFGAGMALYDAFAAGRRRPRRCRGTGT